MPYIAGILFILLVIFLIVVVVRFFRQLFLDSVEVYKKDLNLKKANLEYATDYQKIRDIILPARQSVLDKTEPTVWVYRNEDFELFLGSNNKKDIRLWVQLSTELKGVHIVLDGELNNTIKSNLLKDKLPKQRISLEGDFSKRFRLYCNQGQQIIALQIIAPDIMAFILDNLLSVDIELMDKQTAIIVKNGARNLQTLKVCIELANKINKLAYAVSKVTKM